MHTEKRFFSRALMLISVLALIAGCAPMSFAPGQASLGNSNASVAQVQSSVAGAPPVDSAPASARTADIEVGAKLRSATKPIDQPNPKDKARMMERQRLLEAGQTAEAAALAQTGTDRVLVMLVEFAGTDVFTWTAPITPSNPATGSQWDPNGHRRSQ